MKCKRCHKGPLEPAMLVTYIGRRAVRCKRIWLCMDCNRVWELNERFGGLKERWERERPEYMVWDVG